MIAVAIQLVVASAAMASGQPPIYTDPQANSPAGTIYSIPLDTARQDAAPHSRRGGAASGGRSSNSKSHVVGALGSGGGGTSGGSGGGSAGTGGSGGSSAATGGSGSGGSAALLVPGGQPGSLLHSGNGFGSSSQVPGLSAPASVGFRTLGGGASNAPVLAILLALVVIVLGVVAGARAWRVSRGPTRPASARPGRLP